MGNSILLKWVNALWYLPEHIGLSQDCSSLLSVCFTPSQCEYMNLTRVPTPQVTLQSPHGAHVQLSGKSEKKIIRNYRSLNSFLCKMFALNWISQVILHLLEKLYFEWRITMVHIYKECWSCEGADPKTMLLKTGHFCIWFSEWKTPGELYIHGKRKFPPEVVHLLCLVEIVVWWAVQAADDSYPLKRLSTLRVTKEKLRSWFVIVSTD